MDTGRSAPDATATAIRDRRYTRSSVAYGGRDLRVTECVTHQRLGHLVFASQPYVGDRARQGDCEHGRDISRAVEGSVSLGRCARRGNPGRNQEQAALPRFSIIGQPFHGRFPFTCGVKLDRYRPYTTYELTTTIEQSP